MVSKWSCVNGASERGSFKRSIDIGWLLTMAFITHTRVHRWLVVQSQAISLKKRGEDASYRMDLLLPNSTHMTRRRNIHEEGNSISSLAAAPFGCVLLSRSRSYLVVGAVPSRKSALVTSWKERSQSVVSVFPLQGARSKPSLEYKSYLLVSLTEISSVM